MHGHEDDHETIMVNHQTRACTVSIQLTLVDIPR